MFYYTERDVRYKMMAAGKIIDVAVKRQERVITIILTTSGINIFEHQEDQS